MRRSRAMEWLSVREATVLLNALGLKISERTVLATLQDEDRRAREWGPEGTGWRRKPLTTRLIYELRRSSVERKVADETPGD